MSYVVTKLIEVQRRRDIYDQLLQAAPGLELSNPDDGQLSEFLQRSIGRRDELVEWLLRSGDPGALPTTFMRESSAAQALKEFPLNSPKMLNAARNHGIDERILREVNNWE